MHHGGLFRFWRRYPHPTSDKRVCRSSGGVCEVDSSNEVRRATSQKLRKYDARCCIIFTEGYRSGHNEAVLKTVCLHGRVGSNPTPSAKKSLGIRLNSKAFNIETEKWKRVWICVWGRASSRSLRDKYSDYCCLQKRFQGCTASNGFAFYFPITKRKPRD